MRVTDVTDVSTVFFCFFEINEIQYGFSSDKAKSPMLNDSLLCIKFCLFGCVVPKAFLRKARGNSSPTFTHKHYISINQPINNVKKKAKC